MTTMQQTRQLTDEERAAIEAYSGPVTRVPRGASSMPALKWDEKKHVLRYVVPPDYHRKVPAHMQKLYRVQAHRRAEVKRLSRQGMKVSRMAVLCKVSEDTIYKDLTALRNAGEIE